MKRILFALACLSLLLASLAPRADAQSCNPSNLSQIEYYAWVEHQVYPNPGYVVGWVQFSYTGSGNTGTVNEAYIYGGTKGGGALYTLNGSYTVNTNCTVSMSLSDGSTWQGFIPAQDGNYRVYLNSTETGVGAKLRLMAIEGRGSCSDGLLSGNTLYSYDSQEIYPSKGDDVGYVTFSENGDAGGQISGGVNGNNNTINLRTGSYTVSSDCTMSMTFSTSSWGIVDFGGYEAYLVQISPTGVNLLIHLLEVE